LAIGDGGGDVSLWDASLPNPQNPQPIETLKDSKAITSLAFSPDGKRLVGGSRDGTVKLWVIEETLFDAIMSKLWFEGKSRGPLTLRRYSSAINSVAFSPSL